MPTRSKAELTARRERDADRDLREAAAEWVAPAEREQREQATHDAAARERLHQRNEERP